MTASCIQERAGAILKKCPKMRPGCTTYVKFKTVYGKENYLSNSEFRRNLAKFRISSHHLHIESGRYIRVHLRLFQD
jgi:hypothetical protein